MRQILWDPTKKNRAAPSRQLLAWALSTVAACVALPAIAAMPDTPPSAPTHAGTAQMQVHRDWQFADDGVTFSNRMEGARLNDVTRISAGHYQITIKPETLPINPSPWYGFSISSTHDQQVCVDFRYEHGKPRYWPNLSTDGHHWQRATEAQFTDAADGDKQLCAKVGTTPLRVFAQNPVSLDDFAQWEAQLRNRVPLHEQVIGQSVQGRPLRMFTFGNPEAKRAVLIIGRQHPPETTGSGALIGFVDQLSSDAPLARRFRQDTFIILVPVLNPDGVVEGHWRGNADGKDINRDWGTFTEPETRAVRDALGHELHDAGRDLAFAIDFHSTWHDVFYTVDEDPSRAPGGVLRRWMDSMYAKYPGRIHEKANAAKSTVFKNWTFTQFHAPAVTYEVGDRTSAQDLGELAHFAADSLMQLLSPATQPQGQ